MQRPESIENRWDILYRDYSEVYEAFSSTLYHPPVLAQLPEIIDLRGKCIADVGSGSGSSSLALALSALQIFGIEREMAMQRLADGSVDLVTGITLALYPPEQYRVFIREGLRVVSGSVVYLGIPPNHLN